MQKIKDHLGLIFISLLTILYLWLACNLVINFEDVQALKLNEKGDFLAGIFSPLAFLWLVYGYLQQGQELKQNTKALNMQAQELRISNESLRQQVVEMSKSVKVQQDMFLLAQKQFNNALEQEKLLKLPKLNVLAEKFTCRKLHNCEYQFEMTIINDGIPIKNFELHSSFWYVMKGTSGSLNRINSLKYTKLDKNGKIIVSCFRNDGNHPFDNKISFQFEDFDGNKYKEVYSVSTKNGGVVIIKDTQPH
ncbi:hypothetical protein [Acinetobacter tandoii]